MKKSQIMVPIFICLLLIWIGQSAAEDFSFTYTCDNQGDIIHPDSLGLFYTYLINTGAEADTYWVVLDKDLPVPWQAMACLPGGCFFDRAPVPLEPDSAVEITVDIMPIGFSGAGTVTMRVTSFGDTTQTTAIPLTAITNTGVDVLIVDDDGTEDYETYYQAALDSAGRTHGTLDNMTTIIDADMMSPFSAVVWFTGEATPVLTEEDRNAISGYLEGGGRLFISGQDIASALCDPASEESDSSTIAWFQNTFFSLYGGEYQSTLVVNGIDGHSISDGCTLSVFDGDGASNQISPDIISLVYGQSSIAFPAFYYSAYYDWPHVAAITLSVVTYRVIYFAFGFEAIDNAADRALVMERIMDYFQGPSPVEGEVAISSLPEDYYLSSNYPNPFNAATMFALYVPGEISVPVSLKIYNVLGQEVRTLMDKPLVPGSHLILWDGKDDAGANLASGVYFSRMASENFSQTRKIVLAR